MIKQTASDILKSYDQRTTDNRIALLELLMDSRKAFTLADIEDELTVPMDRVTIYRTLNTFESIGLFKKMVDHRGVCIYMYNHEDHKGLNTHPHLRCKNCGKVVCLPSLPEAYLNQLRQFNIDEMYFLMEGTCKEC